MKRLPPKPAFLLGLLALTGHAHADRAALEAFMQDVDSFSARFEQTLYAGTGEELQSQSGRVTLQRPARFRWEYDAPDAGAGGQTLVSDGERVWLYDPELEQVTVNRIDERVAGTPLVVLMGDEPLDSAFGIAELGESDGISWLELTPSRPDTDFEAVYLGFDGADLAALELRDSFDQSTQIRFEDFDADTPPASDVFTFQVPDGVDVIGLDE